MAARSAARFLGKRHAGLCEQPGACLDQGGLNKRNFSKRKWENRGTQQLFTELSTEAMAWAHRSAAGFLGGIQAGLCEQPGACLDQGGLE